MTIEVTSLQSGGGGGSVTKTKTLTITNAQLLTLPTIPVNAIDAPGANKVIVPLAAIAKLTWFADYTNINAGGQFTLRWNNNQSAVANLTNAFGDLNAFLAPQTFLGVGDNTLALLPTFVQVSGLATTSTMINPTPPATPLNSPLILSFDNAGSGDLTGGNANNVLTLAIEYFIATF